MIKPSIVIETTNAQFLISHYGLHSNDCGVLFTVICKIQNNIQNGSIWMSVEELKDISIAIERYIEQTKVDNK